MWKFKESCLERNLIVAISCLDYCEEVKHDKNSQMPLNSVGRFHYTTLHAIFILRDTELKQNIDMKIVNKRKMHDISWKKSKHIKGISW